jgi:hypothetical protein
VSENCERCRVRRLEVLTPQNLCICVKFLGSRPSARQRGVIKQCDLARRSLQGLRRSLARIQVAVAVMKSDPGGKTYDQDQSSRCRMRPSCGSQIENVCSLTEHFRKILTPGDFCHPYGRLQETRNHGTTFIAEA